MIILSHIIRLAQFKTWHTRRRQTNERCKIFHDRELPLPTSFTTWLSPNANLRTTFNTLYTVFMLPFPAVQHEREPRAPKDRKPLTQNYNPPTASTAPISSSPPQVNVHPFYPLWKGWQICRRSCERTYLIGKKIAGLKNSRPNF